MFDKKYLNIHHNGKLILHGERDKADTLWNIPLVTSEGEKQYIPTSEGENIVCNFKQIANKKRYHTFSTCLLIQPCEIDMAKVHKNEQFVT